MYSYINANNVLRLMIVEVYIGRAAARWTKDMGRLMTVEAVLGRAILSVEDLEVLSKCVG